MTYISRSNNVSTKY